MVIGLHRDTMKIKSALRFARIAKAETLRAQAKQLGATLFAQGMELLKSIHREEREKLRALWQAEDFAESRVSRKGASVTAANLLGSKEIGMTGATS